MKKADITEFETIRDFYWDLIDRMGEMQTIMGYEKDVYPSNQYLKESLQARELFKLAEDGQLVGCVILNNRTNEGYKGIKWTKDLSNNEIMTPHALSISPDYQGKGMGKQMVAKIIEYCKRQNAQAIRLDILGTNYIAERLYSKMGFQFVEAKEMYYEDTGWTTYKMFELNL